MSKYVSGILGATALIATLGAAQFAVGNDLSRDVKLAVPQTNNVNRSAKTDRPVGIVPSAGRTIVTTESSLNETSVAIRVPRTGVEHDTKALSKQGARPVACEAPASVLTDVAKLMESGRCVT